LAKIEFPVVNDYTNYTHKRHITYHVIMYTLVSHMSTYHTTHGLHST
jgi:hypothetical protein